MCDECLNVEGLFKKIIELCDKSKGGERLLAMEIKELIIDYLGLVRRKVVEIPGLRRAYFVLNDHPQDADEPYFEGYTDDSSSQGWDRPYFTFEVAMKILYWQVSLGPDEEYSQVAYDKRSDAFIWNFEVMEYGSDYNGYVGEEVCGEHLYRIGDGWIWSEADEDYRRRYDARKEK